MTNDHRTPPADPRAPATPPTPPLVRGSRPSPTCFRCGASPSEAEEYDGPAAELDISVDEYVRQQEGTYNEQTNHYCCTECYIIIGMPASPGGWRAP